MTPHGHCLMISAEGCPLGTFPDVRVEGLNSDTIRWSTTRIPAKFRSHLKEMQSKAYDINASIGLEFIINLKVFMFYKKKSKPAKVFFLQRKNQICGKKKTSACLGVWFSRSKLWRPRWRRLLDRRGERLGASPVEGKVVFPQYLQGFMHPTGGWEWDFWTINSMIKDISHES